MKTNRKIPQSKITEILSDRKPIIFWDTCGILKIYHILEEKNSAAVVNMLNQFIWIDEKISSGEIVSVTSDMVMAEIEDHHKKVKETLDKNQKTAKENLLKYNELTENAVKKNNATLHINKIDAIVRIDKIFKSIMRRTYVLREHSKYKKFAHFRVKNKMAPASVKSEYKDCYIWGAFMEIVKTKADTEAVFYTDNVKDYFDSSSNTVQRQLQTDINGTQATIKFKIGTVRNFLQSVITP